MITMIKDEFGGIIFSDGKYISKEEILKEIRDWVVYNVEDEARKQILITMIEKKETNEQEN